MVGRCREQTSLWNRKTGRKPKFLRSINGICDKENGNISKAYRSLWFSCHTTLVYDHLAQPPYNPELPPYKIQLFLVLNKTVRWTILATKKKLKLSWNFPYARQQFFISLIEALASVLTNTSIFLVVMYRNSWISLKFIYRNTSIWETSLSGYV